MKVKELIARLMEIDGEAEILIHLDLYRFAPLVYVGPMNTANLPDDDQNIQLVISPWEPSDPLDAHCEFLQSGIEIRDAFGTAEEPKPNSESSGRPKALKIGTELRRIVQEVGGMDDLNLEEMPSSQKDHHSVS